MNLILKSSLIQNYNSPHVVLIEYVVEPWVHSIDHSRNWLGRYVCVQPLHLSDIRRRHPAAGLVLLALHWGHHLCVFAVIIGALFKKKKKEKCASSVGPVRWYGMDSSLPTQRKLLLSRTKKHLFFLAFVDVRHPPPCLHHTTPRPGAASSPSNETSAWLLRKPVRRCQMTLYANLHRILSLLSCLEWILREDDLLCIGSSARRPRWICRASGAHLTCISVSCAHLSPNAEGVDTLTTFPEADCQNFFRTPRNLLIMATEWSSWQFVTITGLKAGLQPVTPWGCGTAYKTDFHSFRKHRKETDGVESLKTTEQGNCSPSYSLWWQSAEGEYHRWTQKLLLPYIGIGLK